MEIIFTWTSKRMV